MTLQGGSQGSECSDHSLYVKMKVKLLSHVGLFGTPGTVACQAPLSVGFPRQEYWSGLPFPSPGDLPDPGIEPASPALQGDSFTVWAVRESLYVLMCYWFSPLASKYWSASWSGCRNGESKMRGVSKVSPSQVAKVKVKPLSRAQLWWDFPGESTGVGCHFLLQGIFPTQGSNLGLPHCRQTLYHLSH